MNAYSIIHNYGEPTYSPDFNFINAALSSKQTALNNNRQKLNNAYDQFAALQVRKDVDQEYIEERLQKIIGLNSQYHTMDLSDDNFASQVLGNVTQLLDEKTKNAIYSTQKMAAEDKVWEDAKKDPKSNYAEVNERYAKAMSDRGRYLSSEVTGDKYQGGADFIEYTDYRKMLADKMPQLADKLKAKWIQTGPTEGYFESINVYEGVTPEKIRSALSTIIGEKESRQMEIDAWGRFDNLDNAQLEELNKSYYQPTVDNYSERLAQTKDALRVSTNPKEKEALQKQVEDLEGAVTTLSSKADTKIDDNNRRAIYTDIFKQNFSDQIVNTYSGINLIDKKIDEVQKANVEFAYKIEKDAADYAIKKRMLEIAEEKAKKEAEEGGGDELYLTKTEIPYNDVDGVLSQKFQTEDAAKKDFNSLFGFLPATSDYTKLKEAYNKLPELIKKAGQSDTPVYFTYNGKKVQLTDENIKKLNNFKDEVLEESTNDVMLDEWSKSTVANSIENLAKLVGNSKEFGGKGADINPYGLTNYAWKIVNGKVVDTKEGSHNYAYLLSLANKKGIDNLTKDQKATLEAYQMASIVSDSKNLGLTESHTRAIFEAQRKKAVFEYGMSSNEFKKIGTSAKDVEQRTKGNVVIEQGEIVNGVPTFNKFSVAGGKRVPLYRRNVNPEPEGQLSRMTGRDTEYYDSQGKEVSLPGFKTAFKEAVVFADNTVLKELEKAQALPNVYNTTIPPAHPKFKTMTTLLQQAGAKVMYNNKEPYEIKLQVNPDGTYGDKVTVLFTARENKVGIGRPMVEVDREAIEGILGKEFEAVSKSPYNAKLGAAAKKINFGTVTTPVESDPLLTSFEGVDVKQLPKQAFEMLDMYQKRQLAFSYEPDGTTGTYFGVIRDLEGNLVTSIGTVGDNRYSKEDVVTLQKNGDLEAAGIMKVLIDRMILESKGNSFVQEGLNYYAQ